MQNKIIYALSHIVPDELGYNYDPQIVNSINGLNESQLPLVLVDYGEEIATPDDEGTVGFFTNDWPITFTVLFKADTENYRHKAFEELTRVKKFINDLPDLISKGFQDACIINCSYISGHQKGFWGDLNTAGGLEVTFSIHYRQSRCDPSSPTGKGCC